MSGLDREQQIQFNRLITRAIAYCIDCRALPHDFCGDLTISLQFASPKRTKLTYTLADDRVARSAESDRNGVK